MAELKIRHQEELSRKRRRHLIIGEGDGPCVAIASSPKRPGARCLLGSVLSALVGKDGRIDHLRSASLPHYGAMACMAPSFGSQLAFITEKAWPADRPAGSGNVPFWRECRLRCKEPHRSWCGLRVPPEDGMQVGCRSRDRYGKLCPGCFYLSNTV